MFWLTGDCNIGDQVNLERAMGAHVRFGGHFVQVLFCPPCWMDQISQHDPDHCLSIGTCRHHCDSDRENSRWRFSASVIPTS